MTPTQLNEIVHYFDTKRKECLIQKLAYQKWLSTLTFYLWVAIIVSVVVPLLTGLFLVFRDHFPKVKWSIVCQIVLFTSGIVSGLRAGLKWDNNQKECIRLSKQYESLANKFEFAKTLAQNEIEAAKNNLSEKFSDVIENTTTVPPQRYITYSTRVVS